MSTQPTFSVWVDGVGLLAPGMPSWTAASACLRHEQPWAWEPSVLPSPDLLPAAERRRASRVIKLVMATACEAIQHAHADASSLATVFSASTGDGHNCHALCEALASDDRSISPTRFHNSVHNTAAGYWCIAAKSMQPSQTLAGYSHSFQAGLLEAAVQVVSEQRDVLLVAYDTEYPMPLQAHCQVPDAAGIALVLRQAPTAQSLTKLDIRLVTEQAPPHSVLPSVFENHAQIRLIHVLQALPLLRAIAQQQSAHVVLPSYPNQSLRIEVTPC